MTNIVRWPPSPQWCPPQDQCDCDCGPPQPQWDRLQQCWTDVTQFKSFIQTVVESVLTGIDTGSAAQGVTDGSDAASGDVGEYISSNNLFSYAANTRTDGSIPSALVLPPGDWDVSITMYSGGPVNQMWAIMDPLPAGFDHGLTVYVGTTATADNLSQFAMVRGNVTASTVLPFTVGVITSGAASQASIFMQARRMR